MACKLSNSLPDGTVVHERITLHKGDTQPTDSDDPR